MKDFLNKSYKDTTIEETAALYDEWAPEYDEVSLKYERYMYPLILTGLWCRYILDKNIHTLDIGCGTGLHTTALSTIDYHNIEGIDISTGMLKEAKSKNNYKMLYKASALDMPFKNNTFQAAMSTGVFTPGHVSPIGFWEVDRVLERSSMFIFTLRIDADSYRQELHNLPWTKIYETKEFAAMPGVDPDIISTMLVYQIQ